MPLEANGLRFQVRDEGDGEPVPLLHGFPDSVDGCAMPLPAVNVQGVLYATRAALPHLIDAAADSPRGVADLVTIGSTGGWVARPGTAVYSLTKFGVNAFSEGIRQELLGKRVRVGVVSPGTVDTEIFTHLPASSRAAFEKQTADMVKLRPEDIADAVLYMVTRDRRVAVNQMLVRAAEQTW